MQRNKQIRAASAALLILATGVGLAGCGQNPQSAQLDKFLQTKINGQTVNLRQEAKRDPRRAERITAEYNQMFQQLGIQKIVAQQAETFLKQINTQFPGLVNEGVGQQLRVKQLGYRQFLELLPVADYLDQVTKNLPGWTRADVEKTLVKTNPAAAGIVKDLSADTIKVFRVMLSQNLAAKHKLPDNVVKKIQELAQKGQILALTSRENGQHDQMLEQITQGAVPVYRPNVSPAVRIQPYEQLTAQMQQPGIPQPGM